jgi:hypothetical protein
MQLNFSGPNFDFPLVFQIAPVNGKQATGVYVALRGESV